MSDEFTVIKSSGNVFADRGFDDPEEEQLRAQLVQEIRDILKSRRMTQVKAADLLSLRQPDVSALINGHTAKFSIARLLRCIRRLDCEVSIVITKPKPRPRAARMSPAAA